MGFPVLEEPSGRSGRDETKTNEKNDCNQNSHSWGSWAVRFLVEGKDSGGSVAIFELDVPAGARVPIAHSQDACEETIYGIEGVITFTLEGRTIEIGPGDALCIPRGAVHRFGNLHPATSKTPAIVTPGLLPRNRRHRQSRSYICTPTPPDPKPSPKSCAATASHRHLNYKFK